MVTWPVFDPGAGGLGDLYPYVALEIEYDIDIDLDAAEPDPLGPEEPTAILPSAWLVERCQTSAALRSTK